MTRVFGSPKEWADLIDPMVPTILHLVLDCWTQMPAPDDTHHEDDITVRLCKILRQNRTARDLPFQIDPQMVELEPEEGNQTGRMDITFRPLVAREDIYFCLEGKLLNVIQNGRRRSLASEYVKQGMVRFISGKYSKAVLHGGMAGYVRDGDTKHAISRVAVNIKKQGAALGMESAGGLASSSVIENDDRVRETNHKRKTDRFLIHHLFLPVPIRSE